MSATSAVLNWKGRLKVNRAAGFMYKWIPSVMEGPNQGLLSQLLKVTWNS